MSVFDSGIFYGKHSLKRDYAQNQSMPRRLYQGSQYQQQNNNSQYYREDMNVLSSLNLAARNNLPDSAYTNSVSNIVTPSEENSRYLREELAIAQTQLQQNQKQINALKQHLDRSETEKEIFQQQVRDIGLQIKRILQFAPRYIIEDYEHFTQEFNRKYLAFIRNYDGGTLLTNQSVFVTQSSMQPTLNSSNNNLLEQVPRTEPTVLNQQYYTPQQRSNKVNLQKSIFERDHSMVRPFDDLRNDAATRLYQDSLLPDGLNSQQPAADISVASNVKNNRINTNAGRKRQLSQNHILEEADLLQKVSARLGQKQKLSQPHAAHNSERIYSKKQSAPMLRIQQQLQNYAPLNLTELQNQKKHNNGFQVDQQYIREQAARKVIKLHRVN